MKESYLNVNGVTIYVSKTTGCIKEITFGQPVRYGDPRPMLQANISKERILKPGERGLVSTGIIMDVSGKGVEVHVRPLTHLARTHGITILDSPRIIDWRDKTEIHYA